MTYLHSVGQQIHAPQHGRPSLHAKFDFFALGHGTRRPHKFRGDIAARCARDGVTDGFHYDAGMIMLCDALWTRELGDVLGDQEVVYDVSGGDEKICG